MECPVARLNNGLDIPLIGLGTWQSASTEVTSAVTYAIKTAGYRHIDCAWMYRNEKAVGEGIRASGIPRSELFITGKLWSTYHSRVEENLDQTLADLGTNYLDLYLIHWPVALNPNGNDTYIPTLPDGKRDVVRDHDLRETWKQMETLYKKGKVKAIGVSNFSEPMLEKILSTAEIMPAVDQLEIHVYNPQHKLLGFLRSKKILPQAYSPLGSSKSILLTDKTVLSLGEKYHLQPADILLGYLLSKDIAVLPKSTDNARITSNFNGAIAAAKALNDQDIGELDSLAAKGKQKRFIMPPWPVNLGFDDWPQVL